MNVCEPIEHRVIVPIAPADAFDLFTRQIARWWPLTRNSCSHDSAAEVHFEPCVGGAVIEIAPDGARHPWGVLTEWDPPHAFAMRWHPGSPAQRATQLKVRFATVADGCEVHLQHGGWEALADEAEKTRGRYQDGWIGVLQLFVVAASGGQTQ